MHIHRTLNIYYKKKENLMIRVEYCKIYYYYKKNTWNHIYNRINKSKIILYCSEK